MAFDLIGRCSWAWGFGFLGDRNLKFSWPHHKLMMLIVTRQGPFEVGRMTRNHEAPVFTSRAEFLLTSHDQKKIHLAKNGLLIEIPLSCLNGETND